MLPTLPLSGILKGGHHHTTPHHHTIMAVPIPGVDEADSPVRKQDVPEETIAYINLQENTGWTALHFAAEKGYMSICQMLLEHWADPHIKNNDEKTAADIASDNSHDDVYSLISSYM